MKNTRLIFCLLACRHAARQTTLLAFVLLLGSNLTLTLCAAGTNSTTKASVTDTNSPQNAKGDPSSSASFTVSNLQIETDILANRAMKTTAADISKMIVTTSPKKITFYDDTSYESVVQYQSVMHYLDLISQQYDYLIEHLAPKENHAVLPGLADANVALTAAQGIAQSITSIINMMRTDVTVEGRKITLDDDAMVAAISQNLKASGMAAPIYYTKLFVPVSDIGASDLQARIDEINKKRIIIISLLEKYKPDDRGANADSDQPPIVVENNADANEAEVHASAIAPRAQTPKPIPAEIAKPDKAKPEKSTNAPTPLTMASFIQDLNKTTSDVLNSLYGDGKTGGTLPGLLKAESILKLTSDSDIVYVKILTAGGNNATKRNLFTSIFGTPKTLHSGGCVVSYIQFSPDGSVKSSGEFDGYTGYYKENISSVGELKPNVVP